MSKTTHERDARSAASAVPTISAPSAVSVASTASAASVRRPASSTSAVSAALLAAYLIGPTIGASAIALPTPPMPAASTAFQTPASAAQSSTAVNDPAAEDIRDIRGPKAVFPAWIIPALIAGAAALALAGYAFWRWKRRRRPVRPLLPFEIALQRLEEIRPLMQPPRVREFSIAITDIVRSYIEQRFHVTAAHRTTEEFLRDLLESSQSSNSPRPLHSSQTLNSAQTSSSPQISNSARTATSSQTSNSSQISNAPPPNSRQSSLAAHRGLLAEFLQQCDLAKFAGMSLSMRHMESLHESARAFVLQTAEPTTPVVEEPHAALPAT